MRGSVQSPSKTTCIEIEITPHPLSVRYSVTYRGVPVITSAGLEISFAGAPHAMRRFDPVQMREHRHRSRWTPVCSDRSEIVDAFNGLSVVLKEADRDGRALVVEFRAYDEGVALRYTLPDERWNNAEIAGDHTQFRFPKGASAYEEHGTEGEYELRPIAQIRQGCQIPLTVVLPGCFAAIAEAGVFDHSQMLLDPVAGDGDALQSSLCGPMKVRAPFSTPWRVIILGTTPAELLAHRYIIENLNPPCALTDTSWIKPGKVLREVTLSTAGGKACVDFAVRHNLQYILFDAGWYGPETALGSDATRAAPDPKKAAPGAGPLDLQDVIDYAESRGIGVFLYVNRRALERQLEEIFPLYARWGVRGVKFGFVNVGSQEAMAFLHKAVRLAAEQRLLVNIHDAYRPTGMSRMYPNLLTQEGVRGNEHMPTATHNATLPFVRFTTGPADYTVCYYSPRIKTTRAHQLALSVVFFSPLQALFWYDRPSDYRGEPEIEFFGHVPTVWDQTEVVHDEIGVCATIARRSGERWFLGSITNDHPREVTIPLTFLEPARAYRAHVYRDGPPPSDSRTNVDVEVVPVNRDSVLTLELRPSGGVAAMIVPAGS